MRLPPTALAVVVAGLAGLAGIAAELPLAAEENPPSFGERVEVVAELERLRGRGSLVAAERGQLEREVRENGRPRAQVEVTNPDTGQVGAEQAARVAGQDQTDTANLRLQVES